MSASRAWAVVLGLVLILAPGTALGADPYTRSYELETQGDYAGAVSALDRLPAEARKTYYYHLRRGWLLYLGARSWDSIEEYRKAVKLRPGAVEPLLGMMQPQMALRLWLDAKKTGEKVVAMDPQNYLANSRLAWIHYSLGRYEGAERYYRKVLAGYPGDLEMRAGLGWSLFQQGERSRAQKEFDAVLSVAPEHASAREGLIACANPFRRE